MQLETKPWFNFDEKIVFDFQENVQLFLLLLVHPHPSLIKIFWEENLNN